MSDKTKLVSDKTKLEPGFVAFCQNCQAFIPSADIDAHTQGGHKIRTSDEPKLQLGSS